MAIKELKKPIREDALALGAETAVYHFRKNGFGPTIDLSLIQLTEILSVAIELGARLNEAGSLAALEAGVIEALKDIDEYEATVEQIKDGDSN